MYRVTLADFVPSPRVDDPWVAVRVEESAFRSGPWEPIGAPMALDPIDTDPQHPQARTITTDAATLASGWYRLVFIDGDGVEEASDPVYNGPSYRPTVEELGAIMAARTRDDEGFDEAGTFTDTTRPTRAQAERMIDLALPLVPLGEVPERLVDMARGVVALRAAMLVETSFFAEETVADGSAYERFERQYEAALAAYEKDALGDAGQTRQRVASLTARTIYTTGE